MIHQLDLVDDEKLNQLHEASLEILELTGMVVNNDVALSLLADAGCKVDHSQHRARIPPDLVMEQVALVPKEVVLGGRTPDFDVILGPGSSRPMTRPAVGIEQMLDHRTGKTRPSTMQDLVEWITIVDALPHIDFNGVLSLVDDHVPSRDVASAATAATYTRKHIHALAYSGPSVDYLARIGEVIAGDREEARKRPPFSFFQVCISPLHISKTGVDRIFAAGKNSIPLFLNSSPIMGATGPISIAGTVALLNAEILGMNVIHQLAHPGSAMVYTSRPSAMDMRSTVSCWGMMEVSLASALSVRVAKKFYGFVTDIYGPSTESKMLDTQSAMERTWMAFLPVLAGTDIMCGAGNLESQSTMSLPQLFLDDALFASIKRMVESVQIDDESLAVWVINQVGPKGQYLDSDHTLRHFRGAFNQNELFDRKVRDAWQSEGRPMVMDRIEEAMEHTLATHEVEPLKQGQKSLIEEIVKESTETLTTVES